MLECVLRKILVIIWGWRKGVLCQQKCTWLYTSHYLVSGVWKCGGFFLKFRMRVVPLWQLWCGRLYHPYLHTSSTPTCPSVFFRTLSSKKSIKTTLLDIIPLVVALLYVLVGIVLSLLFLHPTTWKLIKAIHLPFLRFALSLRLKKVSMFRLRTTLYFTV